MKKIVQTAGRNALNEFAPQFAHFNDDVLFGENWNKTNNNNTNFNNIYLILSGSEETSLWMGYDGFQWQCQKGFKLWLRIKWF